MKQKTNTLLIILLVVLAAGFVLTKVFRSPGLESNLDRNVFRIDTSRVIAIRFSGHNDSTLTLRKNNGRWMVEQQSRSAAADPYQVKTLLETLCNVQPERMVSRKKDKWPDYEVGDSSAFSMVAYTGNMEELANWRLGKQTGGTTYLRSADDPDVYAVNGALRTRLEKKFNEWRDKTFLRVKKDLVNKVIFNYPADSGFVLEKKSGAWMIGNQTADSLMVARYLGKLQSKDLTNFPDAYYPDGNPDITLRIEGTTMPETEVKAWKNAGRQWILASTAQPGVYFSDSTFTRDLFAGRKSLLKRSK